MVAEPDGIDPDPTLEKNPRPDLTSITKFALFFRYKNPNNLNILSGQGKVADPGKVYPDPIYKKKTDQDPIYKKKDVSGANRQE